MPYRDDRRVLESRRDDLRRELDELRPRTDALREAIQAQEAAERELADTEARLAKLDARRASLLDGARVASPCNASWDAMKGDDRERFCEECEKSVYNLSAMTRDEATRLLAEREGSICVRMYRRADGTMLTADCPVGVRRKRVRLALYGAAGAGALAASAAWTATTAIMGKMPARPPEPVEVSVEMGDYPMLPDTYVPQTLSAHPAPGLVLLYQRYAQPRRPGEQWKVWADGRAARVVDGVSPPPDTPLTPEGRAAVQEILALSRELRPEGAGAVPAFADSAIPRRYELFGSGKREATDDDRARLFSLATQLSFAGDRP